MQIYTCLNFYKITFLEKELNDIYKYLHIALCNYNRYCYDRILFLLVIEYSGGPKNYHTQSLVSLFNGISTFVGSLMPKPPF